MLLGQRTGKAGTATEVAHWPKFSIAQQLVCMLLQWLVQRAEHPMILSASTQRWPSRYRPFGSALGSYETKWGATRAEGPGDLLPTPVSSLHAPKMMMCPAAARGLPRWDKAKRNCLALAMARLFGTGSAPRGDALS